MLKSDTNLRQKAIDQNCKTSTRWCRRGDLDDLGNPIGMNSIATSGTCCFSLQSSPCSVFSLTTTFSGVELPSGCRRLFSSRLFKVSQDTFLSWGMSVVAGETSFRDVAPYGGSLMRGGSEPRSLSEVESVTLLQCADIAVFNQSFPPLSLNFQPTHKDAKKFKNHLNPVMLVSIQ